MFIWGVSKCAMGVVQSWYIHPQTLTLQPLFRGWELQFPRIQSRLLQVSCCFLNIFWLLLVHVIDILSHSWVTCGRSLQKCHMYTALPDFYGPHRKWNCTTTHLHQWGTQKLGENILLQSFVWSNEEKQHQWFVTLWWKPKKLFAQSIISSRHTTCTCWHIIFVSSVLERNNLYTP